VPSSGTRSPRADDHQRALDDLLDRERVLHAVDQHTRVIGRIAVGRKRGLDSQVEGIDAEAGVTGSNV
jgi:hypothetical protein